MAVQAFAHPVTTVARCPESHAYAIADGAKCCKYYDRKTISGHPVCDGGTIERSDPEECCPGESNTVLCPNGETDCLSAVRANGKQKSIKTKLLHK